MDYTGLELAGTGESRCTSVKMGWHSLVWVGIRWNGLEWAGMGWNRSEQLE
jgi:hypothetical protein